MVVEMHLNGVPEAIFLRDRDADVFLTEYREWIKEKEEDQIFEFFHNGSIHCFSFASVAYLKVKMPTEAETLDLAIGGTLLGTGKSAVRH
jgi:hypothetical protein